MAAAWVAHSLACGARCCPNVQVLGSRRTYRHDFMLSSCCADNRMLCAFWGCGGGYRAVLYL